ncbi:Ap4A phosphorylase II [Plectosphaerella plurivora]|uniref:Ap4A phosphorylase II n=1 Tax=Plectosphaerella plurivora TaxID=936078 RepID=A0A9P9AGB1_9PEZI|nr:Ap4A phosphorylase II [Plectosphaerella plurivora]
MSPIKAPANLPDLVKAAFSRAKTNADLNYYPTQVALISWGSIPFQLRFSPALANKPTASKPKSASTKPFDPFESPEKGPLFIAEVLPAHNLVLNKFAIVPEHFILATKQYKEQIHLLEEADLAATYACIEAYHGHATELFAFFNSGPHSGASQPHRHIQLLPVEQMKAGLADPNAWNVLVDELSSASDVPFTTFSKAISPSTTAAELHHAYLQLFGEALKATRSFADQYLDRDDIFTKLEDAAVTEISYNMAMTRSTLVICPRIAEGASILNPQGEPAGKLGLNGTVLAGTALVKSESEWDALRTGEAGGATTLAAVLSKIGIPNRAGSPHRL